MKILGSGAFGVVMKGTLDKNEVAVKTIKRNADKQYLKALLSELKIMIYLGNHDNIVTFLGAYTKELQKGNYCILVFTTTFVLKVHQNMRSVSLIFIRNNSNWF